ncbi:MAG: DUF58 domain-containing protein [Verrucomicrobia bacterium]|jgi:uncharacterized protein (DUF58 family)|nr:DUF58 domain-containing protein [Verrucomicrobiota bacterium]
MSLPPSASLPADDRQAPVFGEDFLSTLEYLHIVARKILSGQMKAERRSRTKGVSVEFADHRPYSPGDDFRFIDWSIFLRTDQLFLKLFEEEEDLHIYLLLDVSGSSDFGVPYKWHYLRRLTAAIGYLGLASLDRVFVIPIGTSLPKGAAQQVALRGKGKVFRLLSFLEGLKASGPTQLGSCLKTFAGSSRKRGLAVVLSDFYDPTALAGLNALRYQKFEVFCVQVVSPQETNPELLGDLRLLDAETGRWREVTLTESLLRRYREAYDTWINTLENTCRKNGVGYVRARTDQPFSDTVVTMLRRKKFLQ